jgi:hypothetical protein
VNHEGHEEEHDGHEAELTSGRDVNLGRLVMAMLIGFP